MTAREKIDLWKNSFTELLNSMDTTAKKIRRGSLTYDEDISLKKEWCKLYKNSCKMIDNAYEDHDFSGVEGSAAIADAITAIRNVDYAKYNKKRRRFASSYVISVNKVLSHYLGNYKLSDLAFNNSLANYLPKGIASDNELKVSLLNELSRRQQNIAELSQQKECLKMPSFITKSDLDDVFKNCENVFGINNYFPALVMENYNDGHEGAKSFIDAMSKEEQFEFIKKSIKDVPYIAETNDFLRKKITTEFDVSSVADLKSTVWNAYKCFLTEASAYNSRNEIKRESYISTLKNIFHVDEKDLFLASLQALKEDTKCLNIDAAFARKFSGLNKCVPKVVEEFFEKGMEVYIGENSVHLEGEDLASRMVRSAEEPASIIIYQNLPEKLKTEKITADVLISIKSNECALDFIKSIPSEAYNKEIYQALTFNSSGAIRSAAAKTIPVEVERKYEEESRKCALKESAEKATSFVNQMLDGKTKENSLEEK